MAEQIKYTKLSELVDSSFTITRVWGYKFKQWDNEAKRMISEDKWFNGARKVYQLDTDKGKLDLGTGQMGNLFESVQHSGVSEIINKTFSVKSNGKDGKDIRYYLNPVRTAKNEPEDRNDDSAKNEMKTKEDEIAEVDDEPINLDDIPF